MIRSAQAVPTAAPPPCITALPAGRLAARHHQREGPALARLGPRKPASGRPARPLDQADTRRFEGDWHRAAMLHGVAQALLDRTGLPWEELEACYRRDSLDRVRAHLG
jgi:hypothetical protein